MKNKDLLWVFLHLPKSGGSTFIEHLRKNINSGEILFGEYYLNNKKLREVIRKKGGKIRFIMGHKYHYGIHNLFPGREARYITFLRDPAERLISQYNYDMRPLLKNKIISFDSWYKSQIRNEMTLFYDRKLRGIRESRISLPSFILPLIKKIKPMDSKTRIISSRLITKKLSKTKQNSLQNAKKLLDKCWYVAITENLDEDLKFLCKKLKIPLKWKNKNVAGERGVPKKILNLDNRLKQKIYKDNLLDVELYEYAKKLNKEKKKKILK